MSERYYNERTFVYIIGVLCIYFRGLIDTSELISVPDWVYTQLVVAFLACMAIVMILQDVFPELLFLYMILGILLVYMYTNSHYYYLISSFVCVIAVGGVNLKTVLKVKMFVTTCFLLFHIGLYLIQRYFSPEQLTYAYRAGEGAGRESFFITHPNTFAMLVVWAIFEFIYVYYNQLGIRHFVIFGGIIVIIKIFSDSNTSFISSILVFALVVLDKMNNRLIQRIVALLAKYSFLIFLVFFSLLTAAFGSLNGVGMTIYTFLNKIFSGRLIYGALVYDYYGGTLFGQHLSFASKTYWNGQWFDEISSDNNEKAPCYSKRVKQEDLYQIGYHNSYIYRENCYQCKYARRERGGDLTISDYWGESLTKDAKQLSNILVNTETGKQFLQQVAKEGFLELRERDLEEPFRLDKQLNHPSEKRPQRAQFIEQYRRLHNFESAAKAAYGKEAQKNKLREVLHISEIKKVIGKCMPGDMKKKIKSMVGR